MKDTIAIFFTVGLAVGCLLYCGHCGSVLLHECNDKDYIDCPYCDRVMAKTDCPDFLYEGVELSAEFAQENEIKSVKFAETKDNDKCFLM